jgi:hypothetical protein
MATEQVKIGRIKKPAKDKVSALSETSLDEPIELESNKLVEIYSDMGRTRTGIQNSEYVWSDRTFGMKHHPNGKPLDTGKK